MAIIPASKKNAAWNVSTKLDGLLGWARHPDSNALSEPWAESYKQNIIGATDAAIRSFMDDARTIQKLKLARKLAHEFIALMLDRPKLSTIPPEEWTVQAYRQLFDDLTELQREFRIMGDAVETPNSEKPADEVPAVGAQHSRITVPTNEDVARVVNLVADGHPVQTAAKKVAKNSEHSVGSLKTMYYTWKRNAQK